MCPVRREFALLVALTGRRSGGSQSARAAQHELLFCPWHAWHGSRPLPGGCMVAFARCSRALRCTGLCA
eukprot:CAMPEP_0204590060 /NCGR_PEP_ID=MMETSP0661-20131031/49572_1 /ASSEMBLY_ACC=CAM_ASM_000606 /TAXON_ID=109239 /ORGANISM="Alexandrium margalefi, Strain AMGDE01CS-322" /LENGTH=68 /DNA_ID=CAMNT_0051600053 /DNA_START=22 /DNA_END=225 /DNA_ORIENTATION=-